MRTVPVTALALTCAITAASFAQTPQGTPNFAGTWRFVGREAPANAHAGHAGHTAPDTAAKHAGHDDKLPPPDARRNLIIVTQHAESLTVDRKIVDGTGKVFAFAGKATYRPTGEWTGPYNSPVGSTARTSMRWLEGGRVLELTTVATFTRAGAERRLTTTETWRMNADGSLRRERHETGTNARGGPYEQHVVEIFKREP